MYLTKSKGEGRKEYEEYMIKRPIEEIG